MGYSNYEVLEGEYCTRSKCPIKTCEHHQEHTKKYITQSGIEYSISPLYKTIDCEMAIPYRKELTRLNKRRNI